MVIKAVKKIVKKAVPDESGGFKFKPVCRECGDGFALRRFKAGYRVCLFCGEEAARAARKSWCVAPMHKSNYTLITNRADLAGLNNKGGLVK